MQQILLNRGIGGFGMSQIAIERLTALGLYCQKHNLPFVSAFNTDYDYDPDKFCPDFCLSRTDPLLIQTVQELGDKANNKFSKLKIVEIPDDVDWYINESEEGLESVHEKHRVWN